MLRPRIYATRSTPTPPGDLRDAVFPFPCLRSEGDAQPIHPYLRIVASLFHTRSTRRVGTVKSKPPIF